MLLKEETSNFLLRDFATNYILLRDYYDKLFSVITFY